MLHIKGYKYATLAESVVYQSSLSGAAAGNFMKLTAAQSGRVLTDLDLSSLYHAMAQGYLDALNAQFNSIGAVTRDISHQEAWAFHSAIFNSYRLPPDTWTLNSVFKVLGSDAIRAVYWEEALRSAGDPIGELIVAARTETLMATASVIGSAEIKALANNWRSRVATPSTVFAAGKGMGGMIGARIDSLFDNIANSIFGPGGSAHLATGMAPAPTPAPAIAVTPAPAPPPPPAPAIPAPPVNTNRPAKRRGSKHRWRPSSTTRHGHPGDGFDGAVNTGSGGGGRLVIRP